jgi:GNAT superfamily N-acetyltransferase
MLYICMEVVMKIRIANIGDLDSIYDFIISLAKFENLLDLVTLTKEKLKYSLFEMHQAEVIIGEVDLKPVAFALYYFNYSTFLGKANLFLEDLYVNVDYRGLGYGKMMLKYIAKIALDRNCERVDWLCLDWNNKAIDFYQQLGAKNLSEWKLFRLEGKKINDLADS